MTTDTRPWRAVILSAGYGNEALRDEAHKVVSELGFAVSVYDRAGYPVNSLLHSHASCIKAIEQHDIVIALVDEKEGGFLQFDQMPLSIRSSLTALGVVPEQYDQYPPLTILQAEILTAKAMRKPVICLVPESVRDLCGVVLNELPSLIDHMTPRHSNAPAVADLIETECWTDLHNNYEVPTKGIAFGQLAFLERIRHDAPNYISYFSGGRHQELADHLAARLASLPLDVAQLNLGRAESLLLRKRTPVAGSESLAWLEENGLIISGPYKPDTGADAGDLPLIRDGHSVALSHHLRNGESTALLGGHGMGKSSYLLLTIIDLLRDTQGMQPNLLFASWRELPLKVQRGTADQLIRTLIGLAAGRSMWPEPLPLPATSWYIVLDGIDDTEVEVEVSSLRTLLLELRDFGTLLVSCREYDFDKRLYSLQECFERILRLLPLGSREIDFYRNTLALHDSNKAAVEYLDSHRSTYPGVITIPLWLSMITFLSGRVGTESMNEEAGDYALLRQCGFAFAVDELRRNGRDGIVDAPLLTRAWQTAAWGIHRARRGGGSQLTDASLRELVGISGDQMWNACRALLAERNGMFSGFMHDALLEFWLAEYIVSAMVTPGRAPAQLAEALSFQRSVTTNRLIRQGVAISDRIPEAAAALREAFWQTGSKDNFAKNQIPYLLGRVDDSAATQKFLLAIWSNKTEAAFARYSAAHAAISLGVHFVEQELYAELSSNSSFESMNRWYHRFYYGDLNADERNGFDYDDGTGSAEKAIGRLVERLHRNQPRHLNLRRFELFTLRSFLRERGIEMAPENLAGELGVIESESVLLADRSSYARGIREEIAQIREMLEKES